MKTRKTYATSGDITSLAPFVGSFPKYSTVHKKDSYVAGTHRRYDVFTMLKKLFKRAIATPGTLVPVTPAPIAFPPKESALDTFREGWEDKWETSHEVVESNGGDTEWGLWTDAQKVEENSFADTVLEDDDSDVPTQPMPLRAY